MKTMINKYDYHTFYDGDKIWVSIHQNETLRKDFGPYQTYRKAKQAAYKQWMTQNKTH